jgi:hypothetical protein
VRLLVRQVSPEILGDQVHHEVELVLGVATAPGNRCEFDPTRVSATANRFGNVAEIARAEEVKRGLTSCMVLPRADPALTYRTSCPRGPGRAVPARACHLRDRSRAGFDEEEFPWKGKSFLLHV